MNNRAAAERDTVQIRSLVLPKTIHQRMRAEADRQMRTITAQAQFDLVNLYKQKEEGNANA